MRILLLPLLSTAVNAFSAVTDGFTNRPVVVAGTGAAAKGASLALRVRECIDGTPAPTITLLTTTKDVEPIEGVKVVTSDNDALSADDYKDVLEDLSEQPILHSILDGPTPLLLPEVRKAISFLGLHPKIPSSDLAPQLGAALDEILPGSPACIAWDWSIHLALLQANALPKWEGDSFCILPNESLQRLTLVEYLYDGQRLGGLDPLSCDTRERSVSTGLWRENTMAAGAFTALVGNGIPQDIAACIAVSVTENPSSSMEILAVKAKSLQQNLNEGRTIPQQYVQAGYK